MKIKKNSSIFFIACLTTLWMSVSVCLGGEYQKYYKKYRDLQIFQGTILKKTDGYIRVDIINTLCLEKEMTFKVDFNSRIPSVFANVNDDVEFILSGDDCWDDKSYITIVGKR